MVTVRDMEIEAIVQKHLEYERKRLEHNPFAKEKMKIWMSAIEKAPRSVDAIHSLMDAKEVAMNKADDVVELRRLDWEWSALQWLQAVIGQAQVGRLAEA